MSREEISQITSMAAMFLNNSHNFLNTLSWGTIEVRPRPLEAGHLMFSCTLYPILLGYSGRALRSQGSSGNVQQPPSTMEFKLFTPALFLPITWCHFPPLPNHVVLRQLLILSCSSLPWGPLPQQHSLSPERRLRLGSSLCRCCWLLSSLSSVTPSPGLTIVRATAPWLLPSQKWSQSLILWLAYILVSFP